MIVIVTIGRFTSTLVLVKILDTCCCYNSGIATGEIFFMGFAGLIRGAIAFGLVLRVDHSLPNRGLIVTTALTIVVFSTIFFGFFVGVISKCVRGGDVEKVVEGKEKKMSALIGGKLDILAKTDDHFARVNVFEMEDF